MPRSSRLDELGVVQHVMARGIDGCAVFRDDRDRDQFLRRLGDVVSTGKAQLLAWSLLDNHFHLVVRPGAQYLKDLMRRLMTGYAGWYNRRHGRRGHLFQNRYRSIVVEEETYLLELIRYVSLNPLRARMVHTLKGLDGYPWTGHSVLLGRRAYEAQDVDAILGRFGERVGDARRRYRKFMANGVAEGAREEFRGGGLVRSAGGWEALKERKREERELGDPRILGCGKFVEALLAKEETRLLPPLRGVEEVLLEVSRETGVSQEEILGPLRSRGVNGARKAFYLRAHEQAGQTMAELARLTGRTQPTVWEALRPRGKRQRQK